MYKKSLEIELLSILNRSYHKNEMYSALLHISEYALSINNDIENTYYLLIALQKLNYHERVTNFLKRNKILLEKLEIKNLFLISYAKLGKENNDKIKINDILPAKTQNINVVKVKFKTINQVSISTMLEAFTQKGEIRRDLLIKAFELDHYNLEALICLRLEKLITKNQFNHLINQIDDKMLKKIYFNSFTKNYAILSNNTNIFDIYYIYSIYNTINYAKYLFFNDEYELFRFGVFMFDNYRSSPVSYLVLGLYYLKIENIKEARKCFYEAIQIDKTNGYCWFLLGKTYSKSKESENSIICYVSAMQYMIGSCKPILYLAIEHANMNAREKAFTYFRLTLKKKKNSFILLNAAFFYFIENSTKEFLEVIDNLKIVNQNPVEKNVFYILQFFKNLQESNFTKAEIYLKKCTKDWRYKACFGYLLHLKGEYEHAIEFYNESIIKHCSSSILVSLISFALDPKRNDEKYLIIEQIYDVFDYLKLQNDLIYF
ncbi:anaphase-promoting complex subunit Cut9 [Conglomerata obtusa]